MAHSEEKNLSVYEFIYVDWRRVASLIAQLDPNGVLTALETSTSTNKTLGLDVQANGEAGIPLVKKGSLGATLSGQAGFGSAVNRNFDASDLAPQTLLSLLEDRSLIQRDASKAILGGIALATGKLHILDLDVVSDSWESIAGAGEAGIGSLAGKIFKDPVAFLFGSGRKTWIPMKREFWQLGTSSTLTHGHHISGKWNFLGVISKVPDSKPSPSPQNNFTDGHHIPQVLQSMEVMRKEMGCPLDFYSMTPLLGFREIKAA